MLKSKLKMKIKKYNLKN